MHRTRTGALRCSENNAFSRRRSAPVSSNVGLTDLVKIDELQNKSVYKEYWAGLGMPRFFKLSVVQPDRTPRAILFEDVRAYALEQIDPKLPPDVRAAAEKSIDDAVYGLMMVIDGVNGFLRNANARSLPGCHCPARRTRVTEGGRLGRAASRRRNVHRVPQLAGERLW